MAHPPHNSSPQRIGRAHVWSSEWLDAESLVDIASKPGERLSISPKSLVRRVDGWVVKSSRFYGGLQPLRMTIHRDRFRRVRHVADRLRAEGIHTPDFAGYIERGIAGVCWRNASVTRWMDGHRTLRDHALDLVPTVEREGAPFLEALAESVTCLRDAQIWHADLAAKNILTDDGRTFYFIDLEAIHIDHEQRQADQLRNHVQLLDAFYDIWPEPVLRIFVERLLPPGHTMDEWHPRVMNALNSRIEERFAFRTLALKRMEAMFGPYTPDETK